MRAPAFAARVRRRGVAWSGWAASPATLDIVEGTPEELRYLLGGLGSIGGIRRSQLRLEFVEVLDALQLPVRLASVSWRHYPATSFVSADIRASRSAMELMVWCGRGAVAEVTSGPVTPDKTRIFPHPARSANARSVSTRSPTIQTSGCSILRSINLCMGRFGFPHTTALTPVARSTAATSAPHPGYWPSCAGYVASSFVAIESRPASDGEDGTRQPLVGKTPIEADDHGRRPRMFRRHLDSLSDQRLLEFLRSEDEAGLSIIAQEVGRREPGCDDGVGCGPIAGARVGYSRPRCRQQREELLVAKSTWWPARSRVVSASPAPGTPA